MVTRDDVESFLIRMSLDFTEVAEGMYLVRNGDVGVQTVVNVTPPLVVLRLKVMDLPVRNGMEELYRTLLELNAQDVVHGSYAIEGGELILTDALHLETLDLVELQASLESLQLAASSHMERIKSLAAAGVGS